MLSEQVGLKSNEMEDSGYGYKFDDDEKFKTFSEEGVRVSFFLRDPSITPFPVYA